MMTTKRRPDRQILIPARRIAIVLLLALLRPVSLARPEAQNPAGLQLDGLPGLSAGGPLPLPDPRQLPDPSGGGHSLYSDSTE